MAYRKKQGCFVYYRAGGGADASFRSLGAKDHEGPVTFWEIQNANSATMVKNGGHSVATLVRTLALALAIAGLGTYYLSSPQCFPQIITSNVLPYYSSKRNFLIIPNT